jgi:RNA polymerase sigma factor (sigma-70 family)
MPDMDAWLRDNRDRLLRYAHFHTWDADLAEDVAQDAAMKIFRSWADDELRRRITTSRGYVFTIVKNSFIDFRKVRSRTNEFEDELTDEEPHEATVPHDDPESGWAVRAAIRRLDDDERDLLFLTYYEDLKVKEAGQLLGLTEAQAYRLHERAKRNLLRRAAPHGDLGLRRLA